VKASLSIDSGCANGAPVKRRDMPMLQLIANPYVIQVLVLIGGVALFWGGNALMNRDQYRRIQRMRIFRP
jgi:hypothetical protein